MKQKIELPTSHTPHTAAANIFVLFMIGIFPLIFHDNYIDIQTFKALTFRGAALCYLITTFFIYLFEPVLYKKMKVDVPEGSRFSILNLPVYMYFLFIFLGGVVLSMIFSNWPAFAFNGNMGRNVGTLDYLLYGMVCIVLAYKFHKWNYLAEIISLLNGLAFTLIILNFWGIDPLGMYSNLIKGQYNKFIGTIGNINVASTYLCIAIPVYLSAFVLSKTYRRKAMYGTMTFAGFYAGFAVSSESFLLGCGALLLTIFYYSFYAKSGIRKLSECMTLFSGAAILFKITLILADHMQVTSAFLKYFQKNDLLRAFLSLPSISLMIILTLLLWILSAFPAPVPLLRIMRWLPVFVILVICAGIILVNISPEVINTRWGKWLQYFLLNDGFGSGRGYIWKRSVEMWTAYSFREKLFGCGTDCFYLQMFPVYGDEMISLFEQPFVDTHCELLQMLMTTGLVGTIGYFGFLFGLLGTIWKQIKTKPILLAGAALIISYLAQGLVNSPVPFCMPILFTLLGIVSAVSLRPEIVKP